MSRACPADYRFYFCPHQFYGILIRTISWQVSDFYPTTFKFLFIKTVFMNGQVIHDYNIAPLKAWQKDIFHIFHERLLFKCAFNCCGLHHAFQSDCRGDTERFPASRSFSPARVAAQGPAITGREIRPYASFIQENKAIQISTFFPVVPFLTFLANFLFISFAC